MNQHFWRGFWQGINPLFWLMWVLWGVGHLLSMSLGKWGYLKWWGYCAYRAYNWSMLRSLDMQDRFGFTGPWSKP